MTFKQGAIGIDSGRPPDLAEAAKSGAQFILRYSAGVASLSGGNSHSQNEWKLTRENEIAEVVKHGMDFGADDEWYTNRSVEGHKAGKADGKAALEFWQSRGLNKGATIRGNLDTGKGSITAIKHYIDGFNSGLDGYYVMDGFYAGLRWLKSLARSGHIKHAWVPMAASWSFSNKVLPKRVQIPPAHKYWDLWRPTDAQMDAFVKFMGDQLGGLGLESAIWQNGNYWFNKSADEDVVIIGGYMGFHLEAAGKHPEPADPPHHSEGGGHHKITGNGAAMSKSPHYQEAWPGHTLGFSGNDHFGDIHGNAQSHGGYYAKEQPYVKAIQQQLIYFGYVPGVDNIHSNWADGKYGQPTVDAVKAFQHDKRPNNTSLWGEVWADDWRTLFGPPKQSHHKQSPHHGEPWPGHKLGFGKDDHFGDIHGNARSHGGYYKREQPYVKAIQQQLIWGGYVPHITDINSSWADGKYGQPTIDAVTKFQHDKRPHGTTLWGQVWADDWHTLFSL